MCKVDFSLGLGMVWENNFGTGIGYQTKFEYAQVISDTGPHRMLSKNDSQLRQSDSWKQMYRIFFYRNTKRYWLTSFSVFSIVDKV